MTRDISRADVQLLAKQDQVAQFFHALGFDVTGQAPQTVDSLDIKGDLRNEIGSIERVGMLMDETWTLEVYLFEVRSITKAVRDGLARVFRDRPWDYLLVLTTNYEQIDFQLVERVETQAGVLQATMDKTQKFRKGKPKPRVLSVERQNPGDVALRVLRQLRYTGDVQVIDYCEKLRSVYDVAYWSEAYFNNRALFSDYYLKERLPEREEWHRSETADLGALRMNLRQLAKWYADAEEKFASQPTLVVHDRLIAPVLGHSGFDAQGGATRGLASKSGEEREADYLLYLKDSKGKRIGNAVGFCLAYAWGRDLDRKVPLAEDFDPLSDVERLNENPGAAVVALLDAGIANWAIVTNGRVWRLYTAKAHSRATNYYEIDLEEIANDKVSDPLEAFRYFWFLFRAEAFRPSEAGEISLLDLILKESEQYAHELGEKLKDRVFDSIFPQFAQGFIEYAKQRGEPELKDLSEQERTERLKEVFDGTLTFLYRLLFLLYAESRGLLPVYGTRDYYPYSLEAMKATIATKAGISEDEAAKRTRNAYPDPGSTVFYDQLQILFKAVDRGDRTMNVPTYNGGLFMTAPDEDDGSAEAKVARFLRNHKVPDAYLALGLDLMARVEDDKEVRLVFVDYKSLGVRQLGSIYEGLLEFKLHVALEDMTVVPTAKGKKSEKIIPWEEAKQQRISPIKVRRNGELIDKIYDPGEVYLINDRSERKATGSYYTPDYIVKYIVEHTVGEVLTQKMDALKKTFEAAQVQLKSEQNKVKALRQKRIEVTQEAEHQAYLHFKDTLNEQFFDLKVLDPAMGSGHFLVEAVDYITDRMTHFLEKIGWNPVIYHLGQMRAEIQQQMEEQGIEIDVDKLTDINLLKRQVLKRCIYGVDINPMAVELAKVSVWLDSFTLGAPLSFLDHHLKCGNSLIGSSIDAIQKALKDRLWGSMFAGLLSATQLMRRVNERSDSTAYEVAESRMMFKEADKALEPFKCLANIWTSEYFANKGAKDIVDRHGKDIMNNKDENIGKVDKAGIDKAQKLAESKRFFHWDLEFPEVFYDETERKLNEGFDVVVGNPPYFSISANLPPEDILYFKKVYEDIFAGNSDVLYYFLGLIHRIVKRGLLQGMIVSRYFQEAKYAEALRLYLSQHTNLTSLVDFQNFQVFGQEVNVLTSIVIMQRLKIDEKLPIHIKRLIHGKIPESTVTRALSDNDTQLFEFFDALQPVGGKEWNFQPSKDTEITNKLLQHAIRLGDLASVVQSMQTGINEVLAPDMAIIIAYSIEKQLIHPIAKAGSIMRYEFEQLDHSIIWTEDIDIDNYPNTKKYLLPFREKLASRYDIKSRRANWWEISNPRSAKLFFSDRPRILVPFVATGNKFCVDDSKRLNDGGDIRGIFFEKGSQYSEFYVCAILNSRVCEYYHLRNTKLKRDGYYEYFDGQLKSLPIRRINFVTADKDRAYYREKAASLYEYCLGKDDEDYTCVLEFVQHHLSKEPEESDVVHDLLAYLAEQMLELNKVKRAKQKEFLSELVKTLKVKKDKDGREGIDALVGKQQLTEYAGDYRKEGDKPLTSDELVAILRKNRARLGVSLDSPMRVAENWTYEDEVRRLHKESLVEVLPVKERLRRTDELIDQVVYRLYGLTEEEIGIVEGKA